MWLEYNITVCVSKTKTVEESLVHLRRCYSQRVTIVNGNPLTVNVL